MLYPYQRDIQRNAPLGLLQTTNCQVETVFQQIRPLRDGIRAEKERKVVPLRDASDAIEQASKTSAGRLPMLIRLCSSRFYAIAITERTAMVPTIILLRASSPRCSAYEKSTTNS